MKNYWFGHILFGLSICFSISAGTRAYVYSSQGWAIASGASALVATISFMVAYRHEQWLSEQYGDHYGLIKARRKKKK